MTYKGVTGKLVSSEPSSIEKAEGTSGGNGVLRIGGKKPLPAQNDSRNDTLGSNSFTVLYLKIIIKNGH